MIALAVVLIFSKGIIPGWQEKAADFNNYFVSSKLLVLGEPIHQFYNNNWFNAKAKNMGIESGAKFAPFPPPTAYVLIPLTPFSPLTAKRIWLVFNCFLLLMLILKTKNYLNTSTVNALLFFGLFTFPIANCINFGQMYLLLALLLAHIVISNSSRVSLIWPALALGIGAAIKYVPILFVVYFHKNKSKSKLWALVIATMLMVFASIFLIDPLAFKHFFLTFSSHLNGNLSGQGKYAIGFQSIDSLLNNLFVSQSILNPNPWIDLPILKPILKLVVVLLIGTSFVFLLKKSNYKLNSILISIGIIGSFIVFPATASYHFLLLFVPVLIISKWLLLYKKQFVVFLVILLTAFTIQFHHIPQLSFSPALNLVAHYPRFWMLIILFVYLVVQYQVLFKGEKMRENWDNYLT